MSPLLFPRNPKISSKKTHLTYSVDRRYPATANLIKLLNVTGFTSSINAVNVLFCTCLLTGSDLPTGWSGGRYLCPSRGCTSLSFSHRHAPEVPEGCEY